MTGFSAPTTSPTTSSTVTNEAVNSYAFERVAAILQPFDGFQNFGQYGAQPPSGLGSLASTATTNFVGTSTSSGTPLDPIMATGGLLFPFNPAISEGVNVAYEPMKVVHSNESYYVYQSTENQQINLGDCVWVADTFANARYVLAVIHFLRAYSFMDFGRGRTGKPPSPMWFSAYGHYGFDRVPVLMQKADWTWPSNEEVDYVGIPEPGTPEWNSCQLASSPAGAGLTSTGLPTSQLPSSLQGAASSVMGTPTTPYTWVPVKFKVNAISLIVQHSPQYWLSFNLDDYRSGAMLKQRGGFHIALPPKSGPIQQTVTVKATPPKGTTPEPAVQIPGLGQQGSLFAG